VISIEIETVLALVLGVSTLIVGILGLVIKIIELTRQ
jgi:preprotein translocase subunit Sss1